GLGQPQARGGILVDVLDLDAEPAAIDGARALELLDHFKRRLGRYGEGDADVTAGRTVDGRIDADHVAIEVEGRPTRVAPVHGGIDLHVVVGAGADVAALRRDDAGGDGAAEAERIADRDHPVTHAGSAAARELDVRERRPLGG